MKKPKDLDEGIEPEKAPVGLESDLAIAMRMEEEGFPNTRFGRVAAAMLADHRANLAKVPAGAAVEPLLVAYETKCQGGATIGLREVRLILAAQRGDATERDVDRELKKLGAAA